MYGKPGLASEPIEIEWEEGFEIKVRIDHEAAVICSAFRTTCPSRPEGENKSPDGDTRSGLKDLICLMG